MEYCENQNETIVFIRAVQSHSHGVAIKLVSSHLQTRKIRLETWTMTPWADQKNRQVDNAMETDEKREELEEKTLSVVSFKATSVRSTEYDRLADDVSVDEHIIFFIHSSLYHDTRTRSTGTT